MHELSIFMHAFLCMLYNVCMSEIYVCQKYMQFRNKYACQKSMLVFQKNTLVRNILNGCHKLFMYFKKYKHARNILMYVRNVCLYFQKT